MIAPHVRQAAQHRLAQHYMARMRAASQNIFQGKQSRAHWMRLINQDWEQIERCHHWSTAGTPDEPERLRHSVNLIDKTVYLLKTRLSAAEYIAWMERALTAARRLSDPAGEHLALFRLAEMYLTKENNDMAEQLAGQLGALAQDAGDARSRGRAYSILGSVSSNRGAYDASESWLRQSLEQLEGCPGADEDLATAWLYLGRVAVFRGNYPQALDYHLRYLEVMERLGLEGAAASVLIGISGLNLFLGHYEAAEAYARRAVENSRALGFRRMLPTATGCLAHAEKMLGRLDSACAHYEEALGAGPEWLNPSSTINFLYGLAQARFLQGNSAQALRHDQEAIVLARQAQMPFRLCEVAADLAILYAVHGEFDRARESLREALLAAERLATPRYWLMTLGAAAVVGQRRGSGEEAARWAGAAADRPEYTDHLGVFQQTCAQLQAELGAARWQQAVEEGKTLALDSAAAAALQQLEAWNSTPPT